MIGQTPCSVSVPESANCLSAHLLRAAHLLEHRHGRPERGGPHAGAAGLNAAPNAAAVHRIQEVPATPVAREAPLRLDAPPAAANNRQIRV